MNKLSPRQKEIIYLRFYQGMSFDQIAEIMQLGKQSVYNLMQKTLKSLKTNWVPIFLFLLFNPELLKQPGS